MSMIRHPASFALRRLHPRPRSSARDRSRTGIGVPGWLGGESL